MSPTRAFNLFQSIRAVKVRIRLKSIIIDPGTRLTRWSVHVLVVFPRVGLSGRPHRDKLRNFYTCICLDLGHVTHAG